MEAQERDNARRVAAGVRPRRLNDAWVTRPRLLEHERHLFDEFLRLARACGGDVRPGDVASWFDLRDVAREERVWLADVFGAMAGVLRERTES